jgi:hypothetical protein
MGKHAANNLSAESRCGVQGERWKNKQSGATGCLLFWDRGEIHEIPSGLWDIVVLVVFVVIACRDVANVFDEARRKPRIFFLSIFRLRSGLVAAESSWNRLRNRSTYTQKPARTGEEGQPLIVKAKFNSPATVAVRTKKQERGLSPLPDLSTENDRATEDRWPLQSGKAGISALQNHLPACAVVQSMHGKRSYGSEAPRRTKARDMHVLRYLSGPAGKSRALGNRPFSRYFITVTTMATGAKLSAGLPSRRHLFGRVELR